MQAIGANINYRLDALTFRGGLTYGHGWVFVTGAAVKKVALELLSSDGKIVIDASYGHKRDDAAALYPGATQARYSGFSFHAHVQATSVQSACLVIEASEREPLRIPLRVRAEGDRYQIAARKLISLRLIQKAWRFVRRGQLNRLWQAVAHYVAQAPRRQKNLPLTLQKLFQETGTQSAFLVVDHALGGGANQYRERLLAPLLEHGESVLVLTFYMPTLDYVLEYRDASRTRRFALPGLATVVEIARSGLIREIFYNNGVSFYDPVQIPKLLLLLKQSAGINYRIALHDYFCVCPSHFLLNHEGRYCDLPSAWECNRCLTSNTDGFVQMIGIKDIAVWRGLWGHCLRDADEIICFSNASRAILQRAYPTLVQEKLILRPHTLAHLPRSIPRIDLDAPLHIGIVGHITKAKGAAVIRTLAEEIDRRGQHVPITVIGALDAEYRIPSVTETGAYTPDALAHLIEQSGANLFLFPSVCPETFSYVIAELMALKVPIICFDLGAPAERVAGYPLGRVVPRNSTHTLLDELLSFHTWLKEHHLAVSIGEQN